MSDPIAKLEATLGKIMESLHSIDRTVAKQEVHLAEHMRRTEVAEANIQLIHDELKPIKQHVSRVDGIVRFVGYIAILAGVTAAITDILRWLK